MYSVDLYRRVRRACHVEGMSIRQTSAFDFRFWLQADMQPPKIDFRSAPESRHSRGRH